MLLPAMLVAPGAIGAGPAHRPIDTSLPVALSAQATPPPATATRSLDGGTERLEVVARRTVYAEAPVPDHRVRPPPGDDDLGLPLGPLGKFRLGGSPDPDHDPVTGTYLAPFGAAYEGSSPLMTR